MCPRATNDVVGAAGARSPRSLEGENCERGVQRGALRASCTLLKQLKVRCHVRRLVSQTERVASNACPIRRSRCAH